MKLGKLWRKIVFEVPSFDLLDLHAEKVCETVEELERLLEDYIAGREVDKAKIERLEHEADLVKFQIRSTLPRSDSFLPIARSDLLDFLWQQDNVADACQDAAGLLPLLQVELTPEMRGKLEEFRRKLLEAREIYRELARRLRFVLETGFSREKVDLVWELINKLNVLEHEGDIIGGELITLVYRQQGMDAFTKYHLIQIVLKLGDVLDHMENAGGRARIMTAR